MKGLSFAGLIGLAAAGGVQAQSLRFDDTAVAGEPVTVLVDFACTDYLRTRVEDGVIRIEATPVGVFDCEFVVQQRSITIGTFPEGRQRVELRTGNVLADALTIDVEPRRVSDDSPAFAFDGWWVAEARAGNGLLIERAADGKLYASLLTYDANGAPRFYTLQGWSWNAARGTFEGPIYLTRGAPVAPPGSAITEATAERIGDGSLGFVAIQCLVPPCPTVPERLDLEFRLSGVGETLTFRKLEVDPTP